jgi:hypothetical protein
MQPAWFYAEQCRAEKHVQQDKKNRRCTVLDGGGGRGGFGYFASHRRGGFLFELRLCVESGLYTVHANQIGSLRKKIELGRHLI